MSKEIERKFLVTSDLYRDLAVKSSHIVQAYLCRDPRSTVRVRIYDNRAFLTVKGQNEGAVRDEWEYEIPLDDARQMIGRCASGSIIDKTRYIGNHEGFKWEVDEFGGTHSGLVVAEIELDRPDRIFPHPEFIGEEVTGDPRYYNSSL